MRRGSERVASRAGYFVCIQVSDGAPGQGRQAELPS
jgi:hypothetical protein